MNEKLSNKNSEWFTRSRLGMFIHFGLYSIAANYEWIMTLEEMTKEEYKKYFDNFNPNLLNPSKLAKLAKKIGFKYVVLGAKHHEGFVMWDSKFTEYKVTNTPYKKELLKEIIDAFRNEGLKIGLYYSLIDWNHKDFTVDGYHPDRNRVDFELEKNKNIKNYQEYIKNQIRELLTSYGQIDYLWFDFSYDKKNWENFKGKGRNDWDSEKLEELIFQLQPNIIINDRLGLGRGVGTFEQYQKIKGEAKEEILWEGCQTLNGSWGYHRDNKNFKSANMIIRMIIDTVSKSGNLLLNVGPNGRGVIDERSLDLLNSIEKWMELHSESIYDCSASQLIPPEDCRYTCKDNKLYLHIFSWPFRIITLKNITKKIKYAQLLNDYSEIKVINGTYFNKERKAEKDLYKEMKAFHIKDKLDENTYILEIPVEKPNVLIPVIEIIFEED